MRLLVVEDDPRMVALLTRVLEEDGYAVDSTGDGADDYLAKPFNYGELAARLRALLRRGAAVRPAVLRNGDLNLDPASHRVTRAGDRIELTTKKFSLLELLLRRRGDVLSRTFIYDHVWDYGFDPASVVVDQYIASLRRKLDRPYGRDDVQTIRGAGYRLRRVDDAHPGEA